MRDAERPRQSGSKGARCTPAKEAHRCGNEAAGVVPARRALRRSVMRLMPVGRLEDRQRRGAQRLRNSGSEGARSAPAVELLLHSGDEAAGSAHVRRALQQAVTRASRLKDRQGQSTQRPGRIGDEGSRSAPAQEPQRGSNEAAGLAPSRHAPQRVATRVGQLGERRRRDVQRPRQSGSEGARCTPAQEVHSCGNEAAGVVPVRRALRRSVMPDGWLEDRRRRSAQRPRRTVGKGVRCAPAQKT